MVSPLAITRKLGVNFASRWRIVWRRAFVSSFVCGSLGSRRTRSVPARERTFSGISTVPWTRPVLSSAESRAAAESNANVLSAAARNVALRWIGARTLGLGLHELLERSQDLVLLGESSGLVLREDHLPVDDDVEDAVLPLDQLRIDPRSLLDRGRQTGGLGRVVSNDAVRDLDRVRLRLHGRFLRHGLFLRNGSDPTMKRPGRTRDSSILTRPWIDG